MVLNNKVVFLTGGTGSFGQRFAEIVLRKFKLKKLIIYSRDELKQFEMLQKPFFYKHQKKLRFFIGDIRDIDRLKIAMSGADVVVHSAALKQVVASEYNPFETIKTNILGAQNVIDASYHNNISKVIALSTDKAASPINLYGATKLASDKLFVAANNYKGNRKTIFSVVRYGNVLGSRGSVVPFFLKNIKNKYITVTDIKMTRFSLTLSDSVNEVIKFLKIMKGSEIFVPKLGSYRILDLVKAINPNFKIKIIGIRQGEKIHEELITKNDALNTLEFRDHYVIYPYLKNMKKIKGSKSCSFGFSYNSFNNKKFYNVKQLKDLIKKNIKS